MSVDKLKEIAGRIVEDAMKKGALSAEVVASQGANLSARVRMGEPELVKEASPSAYGLRVIVDGKCGSSYTTDTSAAGTAALVTDAMELANISQPDPFAAPPDPSELAGACDDLDLLDASGEALNAAEALRRATEAEKAALQADPRITNSEGATFDRSLGTTVLATSGGFNQGYRRSSYALVVSPIASEDGTEKMQTGYYWDARRYLEALEPGAEIGKRAAERTTAKLGADKVPSCQVPVVFDPDAGRALLSLIFSCINGYSVFRKQSYLAGREGDTVASPLVTIVDDPLIPRGIGSRPFDGEGLASRRNVVVEEGVLKTYLLDSYSARKLEKKSTASAQRGLAGNPSVGPTNFHLRPGTRDPDEIVGEVKDGLYVTSMMGFGFNAVTGDFSRGAEGFWIKDGKKRQAVGEITVSLGFDELFKGIDAVGNDLVTKSSIAAPTFRVREMTVAGT